MKAKYGKDQEVHVCYEDQPFNDFKSLFLRLQGKENEFTKCFNRIWIILGAKKNLLDQYEHLVCRKMYLRRRDKVERKQSINLKPEHTSKTLI